MRVTSKGQVTIPKPIRDQLGIKAGSEVDFVEEGGTVRLVAGTDVSDAERKTRRDKIDGWLNSMKGSVDLQGMTPDEYFQWIRGRRDDLDPR
jgi:AbrB family looped-hinge helix DNA binding protein